LGLRLVRVPLYGTRISAEEMKYHGNHREYEQYMDQDARCMKHKEAAEPQQSQYNSYS